MGWRILSLQANWGLERSFHGMIAIPGPQEGDLTFVWLPCRVCWWASWGRWAAGRAHCWLPSRESCTGKQLPAPRVFSSALRQHFPGSCYMVDTFLEATGCQDEQDMVPFLGEFSVCKGEGSESGFSKPSPQSVRSAVIVSEEINGNSRHQLLFQKVCLCTGGIQRGAEV